MKKRLMNWLACPECGGEPALHIFEEGDDAIQSGLLICKDCRREYMIVDGIARMLGRHLYANDEFEKRFSNEIEQSRAGARAAVEVRSELDGLKRDTMKSFGWEWQTYDRFGWDDETFNLEKEQQRFQENTLFAEGELEGKVILDCGCGNGRYMMQALRLGAEVIGVDLSCAVDAAQKNLGGQSNAHFVQGDLLKLPFRKRTLDGAFSIGVLMHTGNAKAAFLSISSHVREGGVIGISVYQKQNPLHEINDWWLRKVTTKWSPEFLKKVSRGAADFARAAWKVRMLGAINALMRLEPYELCVYDWYSAPIATHHRRTEVRGWFEQAGAEKILSDEKGDTRDPIRKWIWPRCGFTMRGTIKNFPE